MDSHFIMNSTDTANATKMGTNQVPENVVVYLILIDWTPTNE